MSTEPTRSTATRDVPRPSTRMPSAGETVGHFVVLDALGSGGMGAVFRAHDKTLHREVAIKILRTAGLESDRLRVLREAQALAQLSHPHVVSVYEVGESEAGLFIAMELIAGVDLKTWLKTPRPWRDVIRVMSEAGAGLEAAHAAGILHRDFKPQNVMVADDGRVRVLDFGLARGDDTLTDPSLGGTHASDSMAGVVSERRALDTELTTDGEVVGTPPYLAPEQHRGHLADAAADQYSFCVTLWEALTGDRPFSAASSRELVRQKEAPPRAAEAKLPRGTPRVFLAAAERGLSPNPSDRFPRLEDLLAVLAQDPVRRRRRQLAIAATTAAVVAAGFGAHAYATSRSQLCQASAQALAGTWDDEVRERVRSAFLATGVNFASDTWVRVERRLDQRSEAWVTGRDDACAATHHRGEQSAAALDLRITCYDHARGEMKALVEVLARADAQVVRRAASAVDDLPGLQRCENLAALKSTVPPPDDPALLTRLASAQDELHRVKALRHAGKYDEGLAAADAVVTEAVAIEHPPLLADAHLWQGSLRSKAGKYEDAASSAESAYAIAVEHGLTETAAAASARLIYLLGDRLARTEHARSWVVHATAWARRSGEPGTRANLAQKLGRLAEGEANFDEAARHYNEALKLHRASLGPDHPDVAADSEDLGVVASGRGQHDEALKFQREALAIKERALGGRHPDVANNLSNLGGVELARGNLEEARALYSRALEISQDALGAEHPHVGTFLVNLGATTATMGDFEAAMTYLERALAIKEKTLDPQHPEIATTLSNLGGIAVQTKDFDTAEKHLTRSLQIWEAAVGPDHPEVAISLGDLATLAAARGQWTEAVAKQERALAIFQGALEASHPAIADARMALADTLWEAPIGGDRDRGRARALVLQAAQDLRAAKEPPAQALKDAEAWLDEHPDPPKKTPRR